MAKPAFDTDALITQFENATAAGSGAARGMRQARTSGSASGDGEVIGVAVRVVDVAGSAVRRGG